MRQWLHYQIFRSRLDLEMPRLWRRLWPAVIIACLVGLLGYNVLIGYLFGTERTLPAFLLLALPLLVGGALILTRYFKFMLVAIPFAGIAIPLDIPTGTATRLPIALVITLGLTAIWVISMYIRREFRLTPSALNAPLLAFGASCCVSFGWGTIWRDPIVSTSSNFVFVQTVSLLCHLSSLSAALLVGNFLHREGQLRAMALMILILGEATFTANALHLNQPVLNFSGLGLMWTVIVGYALAIHWRGARWYWRVLLMLSLLPPLYFGLIINIAWFSGWLPALAALGILTWLRSWRALIMLGLAGLIVIFLARGYLSTVIEADQEGGSDERMGLWEQNWQIISAHWVFGTGPAGYAPYNLTYFPSDARSTHNNYMDILAQYGFVGMGLWIWLAGAGIYEGYRNIQRAPPGILKGLASGATAGWVGALIAMMLGDWVLPFAYNITVTGFKHTAFTWIFLGTIISIRTILDQQDQALAQQATQP